MKMKAWFAVESSRSPPPNFTSWGSLKCPFHFLTKSSFSAWTSVLRPTHPRKAGRLSSPTIVWMTSAGVCRLSTAPIRLVKTPHNLSTDWDLVTQGVDNGYLKNSQSILKHRFKMIMIWKTRVWSSLSWLWDLRRFSNPHTLNLYCATKFANVRRTIWFLASLTVLSEHNSSVLGMLRPLLRAICCTRSIVRAKIHRLHSHRAWCSHRVHKGQDTILFCLRTPLLLLNTKTSIRLVCYRFKDSFEYPFVTSKFSLFRKWLNVADWFDEDPCAHAPWILRAGLTKLDLK